MQKTDISSDVSLIQLISVLNKKGYRTIVMNSEKEVKDYINNIIPDRIEIGLGNSITTCKLNIRHILAAKGSTIYYSWDGSDNYNRSIDTFETPARPEYFLTRINALTTEGEILIKDYDRNASSQNKFPAHFLAFAGLNCVTEEFEPAESLAKYTVLSQCPADIECTVALLPFLEY